MPSRARKPAPIQRSRRASNERDAFDETASNDANEPAVVEPAAEPVEPDAVEPVEPDPTPKRGRRVQRTVTFDSEVLESARAAAMFLGAYQPDSGVMNLADIVNVAVARQVRVLEEEYNEGKPFRRVAHLPVGRPAR